MSSEGNGRQPKSFEEEDFPMFYAISTNRPLTAHVSSKRKDKWFFVSVVFSGTIRNA